MRRWRPWARPGISVPAVSTKPMMLVSRYRKVEPVPATVRPKGVALEPCREGAMTERPARARSRRVSALLSAVAVLVAGCTTAGGGSSLRAGRAGPTQHSVAARPHGRVVGHRIAGAPAPVSVTHGSEPKIAAAWSLACAPALGAPAVNRADAASGLRAAVPACLCCRWCACAWACCGCGPRRWPRLWPRSHLAWPCCPRWLAPPGGDSSPIWPVCGPGCGSHACPAGPARPVAGSDQVRSPGGAAAGAS
jgi:hypothetical protein